MQVAFSLCIYGIYIQNMDKIKIRIGGVPEHFNLPILLAIENGSFQEQGIDLEWTTCGGGTGQMTKALRNNELDACVLLTEGIVADIFKGNPSKIISVYVNTPLIWGIHTGYDNDLKSYRKVYSKQYAISRFGSGSHLMPIVDANQQGLELDNEQFTIIKNLDGALESLSVKETDVFYWEKFMTKPYVDKKVLRRVGEFASPWPCFVIAATDKILQKSPQAIIRMLRVIHNATDHFMENENAIEMVHSRYGIDKKDAADWFHRTEWSIHGWVSNKMLKSVVYNLKAAGIIEEDLEKELVWKREM